MSRTSILAVGIAAILMVCALGGAVAVMNMGDSSNDTNSINTKNSSRGSGYSDSTTVSSKAVRAVADITVDLPFTYEEFFSTLSADESNYYNDDLLVKTLEGMTFQVGDDVRTINDADDLADYLCSIGLTFMGRSIVNADGSSTTADTVREAVSMRLAEFMKAEGSMDQIKAHYDCLEAAADSRYHLEVPFIDAGDVTTEMFLYNEWATGFLARDIMMKFIDSIAYSFDMPTVLDIFEGTPFMDGISDDVRYVESVEDLSAYMFTLGFTVIGDCVIDIYYEFMYSIIDTYADETVMEMIKGETFDRAFKIFASEKMNSINPWHVVSLDNLDIKEFMSFNLMDRVIESIADDRMFGQILGDYIRMYDMPVLAVCNGGDFDLEYMGVDVVRTEHVSVADVIPVTVECFFGTYFVNSDMEVECVEDMDSLCAYLTSNGLIAYDGNITFFSGDMDTLVTMDLTEASLEDLFYVVTEYYGDCAYAENFEDMESVSIAEC